jgi:hypothetical protein
VSGAVSGDDRGGGLRVGVSGFGFGGSMASGPRRREVCVGGGGQRTGAGGLAGSGGEAAR